MAAPIRFLQTITTGALIVTALPACDNVRWGGADIEIVPPPPPSRMVPIATDAQSSPQLGLPSGPVLFHLVQTEDGPRLLPVAETTGESLRGLRRPAEVSPEAFEERFSETVFPRGSQFDVFRRGARVGTFVVQDYSGINRCGVPTASGNLTVVASATEEPEFIAFRRGLSPEARGDFSPPTITRQIQIYSSIVAERLKLQAGLPNPRSWPAASRDVQAIEIEPGAHPEMAATYLSGDSLTVGPPNQQGWSIFYIADYESARGYTPIYSEVRDYRRESKAVPRVVDYLDWDEQGAQEILMRVFGSQSSWYQVVSRSEGGEWRKVWEGEGC